MTKTAQRGFDDVVDQVGLVGLEVITVDWRELDIELNGSIDRNEIEGREPFDEWCKLFSQVLTRFVVRRGTSQQKPVDPG